MPEPTSALPSASRARAGSLPSSSLKSSNRPSYCLDSPLTSNHSSSSALTHVYLPQVKSLAGSRRPMPPRASLTMLFVPDDYGRQHDTGRHRSPHMGHGWRAPTSSMRWGGKASPTTPYSPPPLPSTSAPRLRTAHPTRRSSTGASSLSTMPALPASRSWSSTTPEVGQDTRSWSAPLLEVVPPEVGQVRHTPPCAPSTRHKGAVGQTDRPCPPRERGCPARRRLLTGWAQVHSFIPLPRRRGDAAPLGSWHTLTRQVTPAPREAPEGRGIHRGTNQHYFAGSCPVGEGTVPGPQTTGPAGGVVATTGLPAAGPRAGREP